jgi:proline racemase
MPTAQETLAKAIQAAVVDRKAGKHADAAIVFVKLADAAQRVSRRRTANLCAQAAMSYAQAGQGADANLCARKALGLFTELDLYTRAFTFYMAFAKLLETSKQNKALDALRTEFSGRAVVMQGEARKEGLRTGALPAVCPACTLPMRFDEVDWISATRAECDYCGIVVDAT